MKKKILAPIIAILICAEAIIILRNVLIIEASQSVLADVGGVDLTCGSLVSDTDTHGGFHGDGYRLIQMKYDHDEELREIEKSGNWKSLPLSDNLQTFLYQPYDSELNIPEIENGYYYFEDRNTEAEDPADDTELLDRYSFYFTAALYDSDNNCMYFMTYDT